MMQAEDQRSLSKVSFGFYSATAIVLIYPLQWDLLCHVFLCLLNYFYSSISSSVLLDVSCLCRSIKIRTAIGKSLNDLLLIKDGNYDFYNISGWKKNLFDGDHYSISPARRASPTRDCIWTLRRISFKSILLTFRLFEEKKQDVNQTPEVWWS